MIDRQRLIPFIFNGRLVAFITFYITNDDKKYIEADPWDAMEDEGYGDICYISQLMTDKNKENPRLSYKIWHRFKLYIKRMFPSVKYIHWRRWDKTKLMVRTYKKEI